MDRVIKENTYHFQKKEEKNLLYGWQLDNLKMY
jgi:hypothetical protein